MIILKLHRNLAVAHDIGEIRQLVPTHSTGRGRKDHLQVIPFLFIPIHWHDRRNRYACWDRQDIHNRLALSGASTLRQAPSFQLVDHPVGREEQQLRVRIGDKEGGDHVLFFGRHAADAFAATALAAEVCQRRAFDVATGSHSHDHIFTRDEIFVFHIAGPVDDLCSAWHCEQLTDFAQLIRNDTHDPFTRGQNL